MMGNDIGIQSWLKLKLLIILCFLSLTSLISIDAFEYGCVPKCMEANDHGTLKIEPIGGEFIKYSGEDFDVSCTRTDNHEFLKTVKKTPEWTAPNEFRIPDDLKKIKFSNSHGNCSNSTWFQECVKLKMNNATDGMQQHMCSARWTKNCTNPTDEELNNEKKKEDEKNKEEEKPEEKVKKRMSHEEIEKCKEEVQQKQNHCKATVEQECQRDCKIEEYVKKRETKGLSENNNIGESLRWTIAECDRTWLVNCLKEFSNECDKENKRKLECHFSHHWVPPFPGCFPQVSTKCSLENVWHCWRKCQLVTAQQTLTGSTVKLWPGRCTREYKDQCKESILEDKTYLEKLHSKNKSENHNEESKCKETKEEEMFQLINRHVMETDSEKCGSSIDMTCQRRCYVNWILEGLNINLKESLWKNRDCRTLCTKMVSSLRLSSGDSETGIYCGTHCAMEDLKNGLYESENRQNEMKIRLKRLTARNEGQYRCQVPGGSQARCFSLSVIETAKGVLNEWVNLTCIGNITSTFEWSRPNTTVSSQDLKNTTSTTIFYHGKNMSLSSLSIRPKKELAEFGKYTCREMKGNEEIRKWTRVLYRVKIPHFPTIALKKETTETNTTLTKNSAILTVKIDESQVNPNDDGGSKEFWETPRVLPIIGYTVQYKLTHRSIWTIWVDELRSITNAHEEIFLKDLEPSTTYYVRVAYKSNLTRGYYSDHIKFRTLAADE